MARRRFGTLTGKNLEEFERLGLSCCFVGSDTSHPLLAILLDSAAGRFGSPDGSVKILPPDAQGTQALVEFTGRAYVLTDRLADDDVFATANGFGGATHPALQVALARPGYTIGSHDVVLVRRGDGRGTPLTLTDRYDDHPRVERARRLRRDVMVGGDDRGLVTLGRGLVDRLELSVEVVGVGHGAGVGRDLIRGGLAHVDADDWVFAQVAAGNAASLRAFVASGFVPLGSEVVFEAAESNG